MNIPVELLLVDLSKYVADNAYKSTTEAAAELDLIYLLRSDTIIGAATRKKLKVKEYKKIIMVKHRISLDEVNDWYLDTEHAIRMTFVPHRPTAYCNNIIGICK